MAQRDGKSLGNDESVAERTREMRPGSPPAASRAQPIGDHDTTGEARPEATALIDAASMEGLQARSRSGSSMPPPPASDAQPTSVLDTSKLSELVGESGPRVGRSAPPPAEAGSATAETIRPRKHDAAVVSTSGRSKYTPTLRSVDFDAKARGARLWPLLIGVIVFGAGVGTFLGARTLPAAPAQDTVELFVRAQPSSATVRLDGQLLTGSPHTSTHDRDGTRHTLLVEAEGHAPQSIDVVFDTSTSVDVALTKTNEAK